MDPELLETQRLILPPSIDPRIGGSINSTDEDETKTRTEPKSILKMAGWFGFCIISVYIAGIVDASLTNAFAGKKLGTDSQAALGAVNSLFNFINFTWVMLINGLTSRMADDEGAGNFRQAGKRLNIALVGTAVFSVIIGLFSYGLQRPIFLLYKLTPEVIAAAKPFYLCKLIQLPFNLYFNTLTGVMQGLHQTAALLILSVLQSLFDIFGYYVALYVLNYDKLYIIGAVSATSYCIIAFLMGLWLFRPSSVRKYHLFSSFLPLDKTLLLSLAKDTGYLSGKGALLMSAYTISPIVASNLSTAELAAFGTLLQLGLFATTLSDGLGVICNMVGSYYYGARRYNDLIKFFKIMPFIGFFCLSLPITIIFCSAQGFLINLFTNDHTVIKILKDCWYVMVTYQCFAGFVGIYEGSLLSVHLFKTLFWVQFFGLVFVYLPIAFVDLFVWKKLFYLVVAFGLLIILRVAPLPFIAHIYIPKMLRKEAAHLR
eukprot:TRINITY_DN8026_c0_g1_i1.p1 TRINITY_DN8026_c0_g1~~TRINITY_DN8026_c0_g1_i1.p1  ORF type:complete len:486 (+),score=42.98 TRINITY_DN8026_c0_g1_i1:126-1583(+)